MRRATVQVPSHLDMADVFTGVPVVPNQPRHPRTTFVGWKGRKAELGTKPFAGDERGKFLEKAVSSLQSRQDLCPR
jgi:hypothetical protein